MSNPAFGKPIKEKDIIADFNTGVGEFLVRKTLKQMAAYQGASGNPFIQLFGPYTEGKDEQRWADYCRMDWSERQLPAISLYEVDTEEKSSTNAFINGTIALMAVWPPSQRRSDLTRVPMAFRGAVLNFFESIYVRNMLDELYWIERDEKVPGLNEYGKVITWSPNVEGFVAESPVPVTLINIKYRLDLRAWYRYLEFTNRDPLLPAQSTLSDLTVIGGNYEGVLDASGNSTQVILPDEINVSSS